MDDSCVLLRAEHPDLIRRLMCASVAELSAADRCTILTTLCQHLTTSLVIRDSVEESFGTWRRAKVAYKESQVSLERLKRSEAAVLQPSSSAPPSISIESSSLEAKDTNE